MIKQQISTIHQSGLIIPNPINFNETSSNIKINSAGNITWTCEGAAMFNDHTFYKAVKQDKQWNSYLYSNELPKGLNTLSFTILDFNNDDLSGLAIGIVKTYFGPETKLSMFKKKGAGVNAVGFQYEYNVVKMVNSYSF